MITRPPRQPATRKREAAPADAVQDRNDGVDDILVFEHSDRGFSLIGGIGRGAGWAGIVDVEPDPSSLIGRAWQRGTLIRRSNDQPSQIVGPYYVRHAVAVPVGERYVVVLGSDRPFELGDAEVLQLAAATLDRTQGVPAGKLLADELELVHVLRALMAHRPETVSDTLRHIASVAATALSCDVALIQVDQDEGSVVESISLADTSATVGVDVCVWMTGPTLARGPRLDQAAAPGSWPFGVDVASHLTLQIGHDPRIGALSVGHAMTRPRGFTALCQRIGRAVAEAAELLIAQAMAREQMAAERDLLARMIGTDALTGIANRRAWDDAAAGLAKMPEPPTGYVLSCDLDGLKDANDRYGHATGDALIRAAANLLNACVRSGDLVARVGGDEYAILLQGADEGAARRVRTRIRRAERRWRVTEHGLAPRLSIGSAPILGGDVETARCQADERMYASKRRRRAGGRVDAMQHVDRRRTIDA